LNPGLARADYPDPGAGVNGAENFASERMHPLYQGLHRFGQPVSGAPHARDMRFDTATLRE
jgi:hypothetical protein